MISPDYVRLMVRYGTEMNRRLYAAAAELPDATRRADGGAFWGSLHGTLNHLLWADRGWLARLDGTPKPPVGMAESAGMIVDFAELSAARQETDMALADWAARVDEAWLGRDLVWLRGTSQPREYCHSHRLLVVHLFNHQTHHRGQAHALLTRAGADTGDTDLFLLV